MTFANVDQGHRTVKGTGVIRRNTAGANPDHRKTIRSARKNRGQDLSYSQAYSDTAGCLAFQNFIG